MKFKLDDYHWQLENRPYTAFSNPSLGNSIFIRAMLLVLFIIHLSTDPFKPKLYEQYSDKFIS
nr:hypothetical protein [Nostoc sp. ChiSLP03a]